MLGGIPSWRTRALPAGRGFIFRNDEYPKFRGMCSALIVCGAIVPWRFRKPMRSSCSGRTKYTNGFPNGCLMIPADIGAAGLKKMVAGQIGRGSYLEAAFARAKK